IYCFFFQAEDGIRDKLVTGVQTCALPIFEPLLVGSKSVSATPIVDRRRVEGPHSAELRLVCRRGKLRPCRCLTLGATLGPSFSRSEERRVGKEGRSWGWG